MKTKEEIVNKWLEEDVYGEPLSELDLNECGEIEFRGLKSGFISGYTQCQEDMADKKYTESQLRDAMEEAMVYLQNLLIKMPAAFSAGKLKQITEHVISLNKQDNG